MQLFDVLQLGNAIGLCAQVNHFNSSASAADSEVSADSQTNGSYDFLQDNSVNSMIIITVLLFIFYMTAIALAFYGYKEFKYAKQLQVGKEAVAAFDKASNFLGRGTQAFESRGQSARNRGEWGEY